MNAFLAVFKKELKRFFTDPRMLMTLILPGVLIYAVYSLMGTVVQSIANDTAVAQEYTVYIDNRPEEFALFESASAQTITVKAESSMTAEEKKQAVRSGEADLYIAYEEDFYNKMLSYDPQSGAAAPKVSLYYNSVSTESVAVYQYYTACLNAVEKSLANKFDMNEGGERYDLAEEADVMQSVFSAIIPMLLIALLYSGCMSVCLESVAGEKERGTLATVLVTPAKRSQVICGKIGALALVSLVSAASSFLGLIFSLPKLLGLSFSAMPYGAGEFLAIFAVTVLADLIFTVILTMLSAFAKSVKEASSFCGPVLILMMVLGLVSSFVTVSGLGWYCIPIFNIVLCLTNIVSMQFSLYGFLITVGVNIALLVLGVLLLAKMFSDEKIMFRR